ncbi:MAG: geranylgeranyl diphosphate synthase, type [Actinomycetota bacterium]|nr:geranylgeranyl diphosphate synthase, type [Actinomycetota bacterium]
MSEEVQRLALDTARAVADRLGEMFQRFRREGPEGADGEEQRVDRTDPAFRRLEGAAERAFDACLRLLGSVDELAAPLLARGLSGLSRSEGGADSLILPQAGPAGRSSARLWLHNTTAAGVQALRPWTPGLYTDTGRTLPATAIEFSPLTIQRLDADQTEEILVVADIPAGAHHGVYHGQILVENLPDVAFPLVLEVVTRPTAGSPLGNGSEPAASLARYGHVVREELRRFVGVDGPVDYLTVPLADYPSRGSKALRPSLCLATCEAFGGRLGDALPSATAIELLHNAFLVHDDIEDESLLRRGDVTLHRRYGTPLALNAGDALALLSVAALRENFQRLGPRLAEKVMLEFDFMSRQTVAGQALELGWRRDNLVNLEPADYLDLIMKKTCWYTTVLPLRVGALTGSWGSADLDAMITFGLHLGAAFQIRDDILNLVGDPADYGKERMGDLVEGKRTLMLIHLLAVADEPDRRWLRSYLSRSAAARQPQEAVRVFELMGHYGSITFASEFASGVAHRAEVAMDYAFAGLPDTPAKRFVRHLVPFMVERTV